MGFLHRKFLGVEETLTEDVLRNLGNLLRAKRGAASVLPSFGLTETGFRTAAEMLTQLTQEIRENIALYEPRVEVTEIEQGTASDGRPCLVVHCRLRGTQEALSVVFEPRSRTLSLPSQATPEEEEES
jgi:predicted component of type VI protein secretion system